MIVNRKIIQQNRSFFSIVIVFAFFFGFVLYLGASRIYNREAKWRHQIADFELSHGKAVIKSFFSNFEHHLFFLGALSSLKSYSISNFESDKFRKEVENIFYNLAKASSAIYRIQITDSSGQERARIDNSQDDTVIVSHRLLQNKQNRYYFQESMKFEKRIYLSSIDLSVGNGQFENQVVPIVRIASPLLNDEGKKRGVLTLTVNFSKVFQLLPKNMFVQTKEGSMISLKPDGTVDYVKSPYNFSDPEGRIIISGTDTIHYSTLEISPSKRFFVAMNHHHIGLKTALHNLILVSAILLAIFFCLISFISHLNIARFKEKDRAQMAIISSLVELTDFRDPETGDHLNRTKNYAAELTRQLKKNKKFRKTITDEFIDDIFDTASLHDIGKVGIKDFILFKEGTLSAEELDTMRTHVLIGKQVIQDIIDQFEIKQPFIITARNIAAYHHEKYDGTGYPAGLKREKIPLEARIFALADVYDALRSKRPYKEEMPHAETVSWILSESGKHFDPDVVAAFLKLEEKFLEISKNYKHI